MNKIKAFVRWLLSSVWCSPLNPVAITQSTTEPAAVEPAAPVAIRKRASRMHDETQARYYLGNLLDELDDYFADFDFLKRGDPEMAAVIERLGCNVAGGEQMVSIDLEPVFYTRLPSVGCTYFGRRDTAKTVSLRFAYFQKHKQPVNVQATNGVIYAVGAVFGIKKPHLLQFHVAVFPDGNVRVLKQISPQYYTVGKGGRSGGRKTFARMEWSYPEGLETLRREYNTKHHTNATIDEYAKSMIGVVCNAAISSEAGMNVRVHKAGRVASFAIDMLRAPYFFADRDRVANANGRREKILHIVKPHVRTGRNGVAKNIKAHWRGARHFTWNGYDVSIGVPGKHLPSLMLDFTAETWEAADIARAGHTGISLDAAAARIAEKLDAPREAVH